MDRSATPNEATPRLEMTGISKSFGQTQVLHSVNFTVYPGEVHGLLGENGAGKSTLLNIMCGVISSDTGQIKIDDGDVRISNPRDASGAGIAMIHQELQQVPELTVAQNIFLGAELRKAGGMIIDQKRQEREAKELLHPLDDTIDVKAPVKSLRVAQRQIVEIAKALRSQANIIAMDEPTSSLTPSEFERLVTVIERLILQGVSVIYVSHKMDEVFRLCDSATILRDGALIKRLSLQNTSPEQVIELMVGRELAHTAHKSFATSEVKLQVKDLSRGRAVKNASFRLHKGEVLGIAGLVGSGRTELLRLIAGADQADSGTVELEGKTIEGATPRARIRAGLGLVPEERKRDGIIRDRPIYVNVGLPAMNEFSRNGMIRKKYLKERSTELMKEVGLRPLNVERAIGSFSGGNQQKAIIGRWLAADTSVYLFDEPTRGIDVGAKSEIYDLIEKLAESGCGIIVVSSELPEVIRVSDRVLVMQGGAVSGVLEHSEITEANIAKYAIATSQDNG